MRGCCTYQLNLDYVILIAICLSCEIQNSGTNQTIKKNVSDEDSTLKIVKLVADGFLKGSYLKVQNDTLIFIDYVYSHPIYTKKYFSYDSLEKNFCYIFSMHQPLSKDSLILLRRNNYLEQIVFNKNKKSMELIKKIKELKNFKQPFDFVNADSRVRVFNKNYYVIDRHGSDFIYSIDTFKKEVNSYSIKEDIFDVTDFFLFDFDKDDNPEIIIFHQNMNPREEMIDYNIYSIRKNDVSVDRGNGSLQAVAGVSSNAPLALDFYYIKK